MPIVQGPVIVEGRRRRVVFAPATPGIVPILGIGRRRRRSVVLISGRRHWLTHGA
jgi:hypothetical protein